MHNRFFKSHGFFILTCIMLVLVGAQVGGSQAVLASAGESFSISKTGMGLLAAAQAAGMCISPGIFGHIADRKGKKPVLLFSIFLAVLGAVLAGFARSALVYAIGSFLLGAAIITCESTCFAAISDLYPSESSRLLTMGLFFVSLGAIFGPMLLQMVITCWHVSWQILFLAVGLGFVLSAYPVLRSNLPKPSGEHGNTRTISPMQLFRSTPYVLLFITTILYIGVDHSIGSFVDTLFGTQLHAPHLGAYAVSAFWAGTALSRLVNGFKGLRPTKTLIVYHLLLATATMWLALSSHAAFGIALSALIGWSIGPLWSTLLASAAREFPNQSGTATGLLGTANGIGGMVYPVAVGFLADFFNVRAGFLMLAITAFVCVILSLCYEKSSAAS